MKAPKIYVRAPGLLHALLDIRTSRQLELHPKVGASWEGFVIDQIVQALKPEPHECYFWRTHAGAELDLMIVRGSQRFDFEVKRTTTPAVTPSMRSALADLKLKNLDVVHAGDVTFPLSEQIRAVALGDLPRALKPLR